MKLWSEMVKRGVYDEKALWIIDFGLSDRITVNILASYFNEHFEYKLDKEMLLDAILHSTEVDRFVSGSNIPVLLKEKWKQYLKI